MEVALGEAVADEAFEGISDGKEAQVRRRSPETEEEGLFRKLRLPCPVRSVEHSRQAECWVSS